MGAVREMLRCLNVDSESTLRETQGGIVVKGFMFSTGCWMLGQKPKPNQIIIGPLHGDKTCKPFILDYRQVGNPFVANCLLQYLKRNKSYARSKNTRIRGKL